MFDRDMLGFYASFVAILLMGRIVQLPGRSYYRAQRQPRSGASSSRRSCYGCRIATFQETVAGSLRPWLARRDAGKCCVTKSMAFSSLL
jgi:hypothetical protein